MIEVISVGSVVMLPQIKKIFVYIKPRRKTLSELWNIPNPCGEISLGESRNGTWFNSYMQFPTADYPDESLSYNTICNERLSTFSDKLHSLIKENHRNF